MMNSRSSIQMHIKTLSTVDKDLGLEQPLTRSETIEASSTATPMKLLILNTKAEAEHREANQWAEAELK